MSDPSAVTLRANGYALAGWESVSIRRSVDEACSSFALAVSQRYAIGNPIPLRNGDAVEVYIGDDKVITGWVDVVEPSIAATSHSISVSGRSKTCDFVDCSAVDLPLRWRKRRVEQIAQDLAKAFGLRVRTVGSTGTALARFAVEHGETCYAALDRAINDRFLLVTDDAEGDLVIASFGSFPRSTTQIVEGQNMLSGKSRADSSKIYSDIRVKGQRVGNDQDYGVMVSDVTGQALDTEARRYRPLAINMSGPASPKLAKSRAVWEAKTRMAKSLLTSVEVQGWRQGDGRLWAAGELVNVRSDSLGIDGDLLIAAIDYKLDAQGTRAALELAIPEAYTPEIAEPKQGGGGTRAGVSYLYRELRYGVGRPTSAAGDAWRKANQTFGLLTGEEP